MDCNDLVIPLIIICSTCVHLYPKNNAIIAAPATPINIGTWASTSKTKIPIAKLAIKIPKAINDCQSLGIFGLSNFSSFTVSFPLSFFLNRFIIFF